MNIFWRNRPVHSLWGQIAVVIGVVLLTLLTLPLTIPGHFVLRALGRNGFFSLHPKLRIEIERTSFKRIGEI